MFLKRPQYRKFEYQPRFYDPDKDPSERFKRKLESERKSHRRKRRPVLLWGAIVLLIFYVYLYLSGIVK